MANPVVVAIAQFVWERFRSNASKSSKSRKSKGFSLVGGKLRWLMIFSVIGFSLYYFGPQRVKQWVLAQLPDEARPILQGNRQSLDSGTIEVFFTVPGSTAETPRNPAKICADLIDQAKQSLDVAAFELNNKLIVAALVRAHQRGVRVRLVTDSDYLDAEGPEQFRLNGIPIVEDKREALMHHKFIVFDRKAVWTGSMNFTENCAYRNNNHGIFLPIQELAENYSTKFNWMFELNLFGKAPKHDVIPNPLIKLPDGTVIENYFSTHDRCAEKVERTITTAKSQIDFLAFSYTHEGIADAMIQRHRSGVKIRGVFEKTQAGSKYSEYHRFRQLNWPVYTDANPRNMHHKAIMIDGDLTIGGSFNFSSSADKSNDENLLIIHRNPKIYGAFLQEFERIYEEARRVQ